MKFKWGSGRKSLGYELRYDYEYHFIQEEVAGKAIPEMQRSVRKWHCFKDVHVSN